LRVQIDRLKSLDPMVRLDEPDSVHQMRVGTRRLRSTLRSFGKIIDSSGTERLGGELKWLGDVLGEARHAEGIAEPLVANLGRMPVEQVTGPVQARVRGHFAKPQAPAREAVLAALGSQRYFSLLDELDRLLADPPLTERAATPAANALPVAVRRGYRQVARRMRRAGRAPAREARNRALHQAPTAAQRRPHA